MVITITPNEHAIVQERAAAPEFDFDQRGQPEPNMITKESGEKDRILAQTTPKEVFKHNKLQSIVLSNGLTVSTLVYPLPFFFSRFSGVFLTQKSTEPLLCP